MIRAGRRVLVFSAHAADFCSRAGGAIIRLVEAGSQVHVCDMSYSEKCESPALWARDPEPSIEEVKEARKEEIEAAADLLGASAECFDFGDSPLLISSERRHQVLEKIRAFKPDLILTHWLEDFLHPDHVETAQAALWASRYCFRPGIKSAHPPCPAPELICYETVLGTAPVTRFLPNLYVDITSVFARKKEALRRFAAQPQLPDSYEILARYRALEAQSTAGMKDCRFAEGFHRIGSENGSPAL